ncbi:MAG: PEP-CTERM sorting domain-containing protein [Bryobacteraceae bacterium]
MLSQRKMIVWLALVLFTASASASPLVYVVTGSQQFGTLDLATGAFHPIGPDTPEGDGGLVAGPNGSLLAVTFSGTLDSIIPATAVTSVVGVTGFADCTSPTSPCGPTSFGALGKLGGTIYGTDFGGNLYTVNAATGATTLIGHTGIPAVPAIPSTTNPDGSLNVFTESLFGAGGKLYATFDADTLDPVSFAATPVIPARLYQINPSTGLATVLAPTTLGLSAVVEVNGTIYAFNVATSQVVTLNLANGNTSFVSNLDPSAGSIGGAVSIPAAVPEPASMALAGIGIAAIAICRRRRRHSTCSLLAPRWTLQLSRHSGSTLAARSWEIT